jgi:cobalt-zinc-cadmium efflux system membrane fusion protein
MVSKTKIILPVAIAALLASAFLFQLRNRATVTEQHQTEAESETEEGVISLSDEQIKNAGLEVKQATSNRIKTFITLPGKIAINPEHYAHVVAHTPGVVRTAHKIIGDKVSAGETLATLESKEIAEAKSTYQAAVRREKLAVGLLKREKSLKDKNIGAEQDYLQTEATAEEAIIEKELSKQKLYTLGLTEDEIKALTDNQTNNDLRIYEVRAPFAGTIINRHITKGEIIDAGAEVYVIADLNTVRVELGIYPKDLPAAKEGQKIHISNDLGESAEATVIRLNPVVDTESARVKVVAQLDNRRGNWRPGTYVSARLNTGEYPAHVAVPQDAIVKIEDEPYVFVRHKDHYEKRPVTLGRSDGTNTEILSGLDQGETYVAKNAFILKFELTKGEPE